MKILILVLSLFLFSNSAIALTSPAEALKSMKRLSYRVDQGMSVRDYMAAFPETEFDVKEYLESAPDSPLKERIALALKHQKTAMRVCSSFSDGGRLTGRPEWTLDSSWDARYPEIRKSIKEGGIFHIEENMGHWYSLPDLFTYVFNHSNYEIVAAENILASSVSKKKKKKQK